MAGDRFSDLPLLAWVSVDARGKPRTAGFDDLDDDGCYLTVHTTGEDAEQLFLSRDMIRWLVSVLPHVEHEIAARNIDPGARDALERRAASIERMSETSEPPFWSPRAVHPIWSFDEDVRANARVARILFDANDLSILDP